MNNSQTVVRHSRTLRISMVLLVISTAMFTLGSNQRAIADQNEQPGSTVSPSISFGYEHGCAVVGNVGVRCWGSNNFGQLGIGTTDTIGDDEKPEVNANLGGASVKAISAGNRYTCALLAGGQVRCWGLNDKGQLGIASISTIGDDETPTTNVNLGGATATSISAGRNHTCAVLSGGNVRCWGNNLFGQLGIASTTNIGDNESPTTNVNLGGITVTSITAGNAHTCALLSNGNVRCWGDNFFGQLGIGNQTTIGDNEIPVTDVNLGGKTVFAIAAGEDHTCALLYPTLPVAPGYDVRCWGYNRYGQLGIGTTITIGDNEFPTTNVNLSGNAGFGAEPVALSAGGDTSCVLLLNGNVRCWGQNAFLQLGITGGNVGDNVGENPTTNVNLGGTTASAITTGSNNSCAVLTTGAVTCWGLAGVGQLGTALFVSPSLSNGNISDLVIGPDTTNPTPRLPQLGGGPYPSSPVRLTGTSADASGIASVQVAIYRSIGSGQYWNGTGWQSTFIGLPATLVRYDGLTVTSTTDATVRADWQYVFNGPPGGIFGFAVLAYDVAGNLGVHPLSPFEIADTILPAATMTSPTNGQAVGAKPVAITGTANDNAGISGVRVAVYRPIGAGQYWNGTSWQADYIANTATLSAPGSASTNWSYSFNPPQSGGSYFVTAMVLDTSQHYDFTPFPPFTLPDSTPPNATLSPGTGTTASGPFTISGTATDNSSIYATYVAIYRVSTAQFWNGTAWQATFASVPATTAAAGTTSSTYTYSFTPPAPGAYLIGALPIDSNYNYRFVAWNTISAT
jgi:alpha-tubulin suppressor-like RCC1 family protein